jgi:rod shape-determining protein MreD
MRDFLIFLPITLFFLALRSTIFKDLPLPDLPLLIVFYIAYTRPSLEGVVLSFVLGYIDDVFSAAVIGSTSFSFIFVFAFVYLVSKKVHFSTPGIKALGASVIALLKGTITYIILSFVNFNISFLAYVLPAVLLTGLFSPAIIAFMSWLDTLMAPHTSKGDIL